MTSFRECGDCNACCTVLSVDDGDFHKPRGVTCSLLKGGKCSIYDTKPSLCTSYMCMYLAGREAGKQGEFAAKLIHANERPDKCGLMFSINDPESTFSKKTGQITFTCYELTAGAIDSYVGNKMIKRIAKKVIVIVKLHNGKTMFLGPNRVIGLVNEFNRQQGAK